MKQTSKASNVNVKSILTRTLEVLPIPTYPKLPNAKSLKLFLPLPSPYPLIRKM